ncbi:MAG: transporter substrate-binding domain-containing protein [Bacillota bacterium]|nr:transporter substrate-binding domain-containing protein [Bacillota bacterium]
MKKLLIMVLMLAMVLAFAACAAEEPAAEGDTAAENDPADNVLVMATNAAFSPYEYYEGGEIVGIDAEIAGLIAEKLGMELEIMDIEFNSIIGAVQTGKADMAMAGMTVTEERLQSVNFSTSYATGVQVVIVKEGGRVASVDDMFELGDVIIGAQEATTGDLYCTWDIEDEGLGTVQRFNKGADAVQALLTDKVDCVVIDNEPAKSFVAANPDGGLSILDTEYALEEYAIAIAKENIELLAQVNIALEELIADGSVQAILDKYISAE